ncbi:MAG: sulfurtransferase [Rhodospirillaceae bacterium]|nr:sulfurtransferase [Rhodospirillaceae bacterium]
MSNPTYRGDIDVTEAWRRLGADPATVLIDVRTRAEWQYVGLPDLSSLGKEVVPVEWKQFPGGTLNGGFIAEVSGRGLATDTPILLICRSGQRSRDAAIALTAAGFEDCTNVDGGFEGNLDADGHRGTADGWKASGLPWRQS